MNHLPVDFCTKLLTMLKALSPWSMGTKWPALFTVLNSRSPTDFKYPATFPPTFHVENRVSLS